MFRSFLNGIGFGFGFSLAIAIVVFVLSQFSDLLGENLIVPANEEGLSYEEMNVWHDLPLEEKIEKSTAIAILRFKKEEQGLNRAYVDQVFKRQSNVSLKVEVGDRVERSDFYSQGGMARDRNGVVVFYIRKPGVEIAQSYLYGDRMVGEGDIPLEIFLNKYEEKIGNVE